LKEKLAALMQNKNFAKVLFIAGISAVILIFISSYFPDKEEGRPETEIYQTFSAEEYRQSLEEAVQKIVSGISGDAGAIVTVTLDTGIVYEYAKEIKSSDEKQEQKESLENEQKIVTVKCSDGKEQPLIITSHMPKVRGVSVICNLKNNEIAGQIEAAVTAALNINSRKIYIGRKTG
jgi:stage III sporulation protein AG